MKLLLTLITLFTITAHAENPDPQSAVTIVCQNGLFSGVVIKFTPTPYEYANETYTHIGKFAYILPSRVQNAPLQYEPATILDTGIATRVITGDHYEIKLSSGIHLTLENDIYPYEQSSLSSFKGTLYWNDQTAQTEALTCEFQQDDENSIAKDWVTDDACGGCPSGETCLSAHVREPHCI
jgi:hypothetical protein